MNAKFLKTKGGVTMNETIEQILGHYSVREFKDKPLSAEQITLLVKSAQAASTSNFVQAYSVIGVSDKSIRKELAKIANNMGYIEKTGQFFVFVADLARNKRIAEAYNTSVDSLETVEKFLVAVIDAALAAQNMALAAESMGLGVCYIGGIRNDLKKVSELLQIPDYAVPLFGLTVGHPVQNSAPKPRMPEGLIYHENTYQEKEKDLYYAYDKIIRDYYKERTGGARVEAWTEQIAKGMSHKTRTELKAFIESKHLGVK